MKFRRRLVPAASILAAAAAVSAVTASASAYERRDGRMLPLVSAGAVDLVMRGGTPRTRVVIPLPHGWVRAGLRAELQWRGSPLLADRSLIRVDVDGIPRATTRVGPGTGRLVVHAPLRPVAGQRMVLDIGGVLATADDDCPPPDAPGAYLRLDGRSMLMVSGVRGPRPPAVTSLPGALVERLGDVVPPLRLRLPPRPKAEHVQAAALVAGAVSSATGFPGTPVRVALGDGGGPGGPQVRIREAGDSRIGIARRPDGAAAVTLSGTEQEVVRAASSIAVGRTATLTGATMRGTSPIEAPRRHRLAGGARLSPVEVAGSGAKSLRLPFRVPEGELAYEPARLELLLGFDAPAGGRVAVAINGRPLGARRLARAGTGRLRLTYRLHQGDLRAGDNAVELRVDLASAAAGRCAPLASSSRLVVLKGSGLTWKPGPRPVEASLALWPFPASVPPGWSGSTVVMPSDPSAAEVQAVVEVLAEAARWGGGPVLPRVVLGDVDPAREEDRDLLVLVRGLRVPRGLPAPAHPARGLLTALRDGDRVVVLAFGSDALRPLGQGYFLGRVKGRAALVRPNGAVRVTERRVPEALPLQSPQSQFRWALVALVAVCVGALAWLLARAMRRLRALPPPMVVAEIGHADSVLEKDVVRPVADEQSPERASTADEAVAAWRRLSAEEGESEDRR